MSLVVIEEEVVHGSSAAVGETTFGAVTAVDIYMPFLERGEDGVLDRPWGTRDRPISGYSGHRPSFQLTKTSWVGAALPVRADAPAVPSHRDEVGIAPTSLTPGQLLLGSDGRHPERLSTSYATSLRYTTRHCHSGYTPASATTNGAKHHGMNGRLRS